jgi:hypothetical protein
MVLQRDVGAPDQVPDGPRYQDLAGAGGGHDPGGQVDRRKWLEKLVPVVVSVQRTDSGGEVRLTSFWSRQS